MPCDSDTDGSLVHFVDDEDGYFRWLRTNGEGFVVNTYRKPSAKYLVLHLTTCFHISDTLTDNYTTKQYSKICSTKRFVLNKCTQQHFQRRPDLCEVCSP
jgi:putative restriction endonuclease